MIDATVVNRDPVTSRVSRVASCDLASPEPRGVSLPRGAPPEGPSPGGVGLVAGDDVGVGSGAGEDVWVDDGVGSGLGEGDGSGEGSDDGDGEGSGVGDGVGEGFFAGSAARAPVDTSPSVQAIAQRATRLAA
jgi:hypothetical protein